ncbi:hypothetical protein NDU88_002172 [Pleurodeles waltl]|uniref:Uncharacterized protein n=1 Tax=Pleurodeles waltl TaxID=8319 RepID=A0AAV7M1D8_PLEWA|nr:hypothetical protein NDU88_002172 [Pleurodeles waltl]
MQPAVKMMDDRPAVRAHTHASTTVKKQPLQDALTRVKQSRRSALKRKNRVTPKHIMQYIINKKFNIYMEDENIGTYLDCEQQEKRTCCSQSGY